MNLSKFVFLAIAATPLIEDQKISDQYPKLYQDVAYEPYYHKVKHGETLSTIALGYYGYLIPMVVEETGEHPNDFIQAAVEQIGRENNIPPSRYHRIYEGQRLLMPRIVEDNCADYVRKDDWYFIDKMQTPKRSLRPLRRPTN